MAADQFPLADVPVRLSNAELRSMLRLVRLTYALSQRPRYRQLVLPQLPEVARFDPGHASLMMGYDFHLTDAGPRLIEVNTNAGGGYLAWLAQARHAGQSPDPLPPRLSRRLLDSFHQEWRAFAGAGKSLKSVVIVDEEPDQQPLYPEMQAVRSWLAGQGLTVQIADPQDLQADAAGVCHQGRPVDLIYNRHCDFFLETEPLAGLRAAYLAGSVCLSPNPFSYGLLADKRRMIIWSDEQALTSLGMVAKDRNLLLELVPPSRLLAACNAEEIWQQRKDLVFKPVTRFGSRGVLLGKSISRSRFAQQDPATTLVQGLVPAGLTEGEGGVFKTDLRLFVYRDRLLGPAARLYQGQVTNLSTEGGGFAPLLLH
ncbi:MAG: hypothetical protein RQ754_02120 [Desulfuromonadales bacterium]|nr:hypothetical protein [Desulfuromonadales bacterium]